MKKLHLLAVMTVVAALSATPAFAKAWVVDYGKSSLNFVAKQGDKPLNGTFRKFDAIIDFDPANPKGGTIETIVDIGSATVGNAERDSYLPNPDWFNTASFPKAVFHSADIRPAGGANCFEAIGDLKLKGATQPLKVPFCLTTTNGVTHATGELTLLRKSYNIGAGSADQMIQNPVVVTIDITAKQAD